MVERIEDLNLPAAIVTRLIKEALPPGANVSKEARAGISKAASVFVIYLTATSTLIARKSNLKAVQTNNIFEALEELEFGNFTEPLKKELETFRKIMKEKKDVKNSKKATTEE